MGRLGGSLQSGFSLGGWGMSPWKEIGHVTASSTKGVGGVGEILLGLLNAVDGRDCHH